MPVFFEAANSRLFQFASHLYTTLRLALLVNEFRSRVGGPVRVVVGAPVEPAAIAARAGDARALMDVLRARTNALSPSPNADLSCGFEFEDFH